MNMKVALMCMLAGACVMKVESTMAANISSVDRFKDQGRLNVYLRSVTIDTRVQNKLLKGLFGEIPGGDRYGGTAVGSIVDYNSKYLGGIIGFDGSLYGVAPIDSRNDSQELLDDRHGHNEGFFKLGQGYLKLRYEQETWDADMQIGRGRLDAGTLETLDTRVVPETYRGARSHLNFRELGIGPLPGVLSLEAAVIDQASPRDRGEFMHIKSESGETIDSVRTYAISYDLKAVGFSFARGVAENYNQNDRYKFIVRIPLGEDLGAVIDSQFYRFKKAGAVWDKDRAAGDAAYDDHATWANINLGFKADRLRFGISFSKTNANLSGGRLGFAYFDHGNNVSGAADVWTRSGNDFNNDDEKTWQIAAEYDLSGLQLFGVSLDGFKAATLFKRGTFDATNPLNGRTSNVTERQNEYRFYYRFDDEHNSGLSVGLVYTDYRISEDFVSLISAQASNVTTGQELRTYIDYAF